MKALLLISCSAFLFSCSSMYFGAMEKVGFHKREILVSRVKKAKNSEQETKEVFQSALDQFIQVTNYNGGELEAQYKKLEAAYEDAESQAADVRERHDEVESVGGALFKEWDKEIKQYSDPKLRAESSAERAAAMTRYKSLTAQMRKAEKSLQPVLTQFHDHVLILKHHLNARAISSLEGQVTRTKMDVSRLITEMERSIKEADAFLSTIR